MLLLVLSFFNLFSAGDFLVAPTRLDIDISRPQASSYIVTNVGRQRIRLSVSPIYIPYNKTAKLSSLVKDRSFEDLSKFIRLSPRTVSLKPGQKRIIRLIVRPNRTLKDGEYRAHILFKTIAEKTLKTKKKSRTMGVSFKIEMATAVYGYIGNASPNLEYKCLPKSTIEVKNIGNKRFDGWLIIKDIKTAKTLEKKKIFLLRESKSKTTLSKKYSHQKSYTIDFVNLNNNKSVNKGICKFR